jgi:hypothetical protein
VRPLPAGMPVQATEVEVSMALTVPLAITLFGSADREKTAHRCHRCRRRWCG